MGDATPYYKYNQSAVDSYPDIESRIGSDSRNALLKTYWLELPSGLENKTILDVGSGDGDITAKLAIQNSKSRVVGVDLSVEFLEIAKKKYSLPNLVFKEMNFEKLNGIQDNTVDLITSVYALDYSTDYVHLFSHFALKMKNGGKIKFLVNVLEGKCGQPLPEAVLNDRVYPSVLSKTSDHTVLDYGHTHEETVYAMERAGFYDINVNKMENSEKLGGEYKYKNDVCLFELIVQASFSRPL